MTRWLLPVGLAVFALPAPTTAQPAGVRVTTLPAVPVVERDEHQQLLNFDFSLQNESGHPREVVRIEVAVYDRQDRLVRRQFIWASGAASPALLTVPDRVVPPGQRLSLFNPFYAFPSNIEIGRLHYQFVFETRGIEPVSSAEIDVKPVAAETTTLTLPVDGPAIVYDGHDFYSHHRRIPIGGAMAEKLGLHANPVRFANDFTPLGPQGELARGPLDRPANWYAFGATVRAPAAGEVVSSANDVPDNRIENGRLVTAEVATSDELRAALGNHVVIRHATHEYSVLAHLEAGTVTVVPGDRVTSGQVVGRIGFSGDTGFHVHVHQMLVTEATMAGEGLPSYFHQARRVALPRGPGSAGPILSHARLDTGDIVEAVPPR